MKRLIKRIQVERIKKLLKKIPVVAVLGARQVGKTTLVRDLLGDERTFYTFDEPSVISFAQSNPYAFLTQHRRITIDEVQKLPNILSEIKRIVDEKRIPGQFIITGSANITMLSKISETLAGRIVFVELLPLSIFEIYSQTKDPPKAIRIITATTSKKCWELLNSTHPKQLMFEETVFRGGYPPAWLDADDFSRQEWFGGYVRTYLERDVRDLSRIQRLHDYQKFMALTAFRSAQVLSRTDLARDCGIPYTTANHYFDLLLKTYQIFLLQPYFKNIGKRLIKSPKLMWNDTGLVLYLQGINKWSVAETLGRSSFLVENKAILEVKTLLSCYLPLAKIYYWRTNAGAEIDLVINNDGRLIPVEIKWSENVSYRDTVSIDIFLKDFRRSAPWGIVLYRGRELLKLKENIFLVPFEYFLD